MILFPVHRFFLCLFLFVNLSHRKKAYTIEKAMYFLWFSSIFALFSSWKVYLLHRTWFRIDIKFVASEYQRDQQQQQLQRKKEFIKIRYFVRTSTTNSIPLEFDIRWTWNVVEMKNMESSPFSLDSIFKPHSKTDTHSHLGSVEECFYLNIQNILTNM